MGVETDLKIKAATRDLVALAGGPLRAERLARGTQSRFSEYGAPHTDRFIAADQIAALEAECGEPVVTRVLADLLGFDLVPREAPSAAADLHAQLAGLIHEASAIESDLAAALADLRITAPEARKIITGAEATIARLHGLVAALRPRPLTAIEPQAAQPVRQPAQAANAPVPQITPFAADPFNKLGN